LLQLTIQTIREDKCTGTDTHSVACKPLFADGFAFLLLLYLFYCEFFRGYQTQRNVPLRHAGCYYMWQGLGRRSDSEWRESPDFNLYGKRDDEFSMLCGWHRPERGQPCPATPSRSLASAGRDVRAPAV